MRKNESISIQSVDLHLKEEQRGQFTPIQRCVKITFCGKKLGSNRKILECEDFFLEK